MKDSTKKKDSKTSGAVTLSQICNGLINKGVSREKLEEYSEIAGYSGIPGSFSYRCGQIMKGALVFGFGAFGTYLGSKINDPSLASESVCGLFGLAFGLYGSVHAEDEDILLMDSLVKNHPNELRQAFTEQGFPQTKIDEIFKRNFYQEKMDILCPDY